MMNAAVDRASENELLISLVRGHRSLWDQASQDYRNASLRNASWIAVAKGLGLSGTNDEVLKISRRWRNLRDTFAKKLRDSRKKSGAAAGEPTSTWKNFDDMLFLRDILEPRQTTTNMEIFRDDSAEEILSQYSESPSEILLPMVEGRHTDTTHTNTINSLPSTPSGLSGSPLFPMPPSWTRVSCLDKKTFDYAYKEELVAAAEYNRKASGVQSIVLWELAKQSTATSAPSLDFPLPNADSHYILHLSRK
ncbi:uncharacterized protein LOC125947175 [Dermacentor silvarum]|uniref:uncharacterized protein LOC125947175 n=1 Tax=Dermacentor silvarum TaxID=543639 RepID=UPI0021008ED2|nr:uncharacterized protein LOC125947175 [Dermacentor silvarum]